jgi:hypothetical protein
LVSDPIVTTTATKCHQFLDLYHRPRNFRSGVRDKCRIRVG